VSRRSRPLHLLRIGVAQSSVDRGLDRGVSPLIVAMTSLAMAERGSPTMVSDYRATGSSQRLPPPRPGSWQSREAPYPPSEALAPARW
jgi:hypothetical protein